MVVSKACVGFKRGETYDAVESLKCLYARSKRLDRLVAGQIDLPHFDYVLFNLCRLDDVFCGRFALRNSSYS